MAVLAVPCPAGSAGCGGTGDPHPHPHPRAGRASPRPLLPPPGRGERSGRRAPGRGTPRLRVFPNSGPSGGMFPLFSCVFSSTPSEKIEETSLSLSPPSARPHLPPAPGLGFSLCPAPLPAGKPKQNPYKSHLSDKCFPRRSSCFSPGQASPALPRGALRSLPSQTSL